MANQRTVHLNAFETTLSGAMNTTQTSATLTNAGALAAPCWLVIDKDDPAKREYVLVTAVVGDVLTVTRYQSGSAAASGISHDIDASVVLTPTRQSFDDLHDRVESHNHSNAGTPNSGAIVSHNDLTGITTDNHHDQDHAFDGADHTGYSTIAQHFVPTGGMVMHAGAAQPTGWLWCDGAAVSRATYAALFAAIGVFHGAGDGTTTFNVPDMRGRFPAGQHVSGTPAVLGSTGGAWDHTHTQPNHSHTVDPPSTASGGPSGSSSNIGTGSPNLDVATSNHTHNTNIASFNSGSDGNDVTGVNNPPWLAINFIIKT